jgi:hypothetical protein
MPNKKTSNDEGQRKEVITWHGSLCGTGRLSASGHLHELLVNKEKELRQG